MLHRHAPTTLAPTELALARVRALAARARACALAGACVALLAACGGGGGGDAGLGATSVTPPAPPPSTPPAPPPPASAPLVAPGTWVVMGSSTASGAGATAQPWVERMRAGYSIRSVRVDNIAKGGTTTYAGLSPSSTRLVAGRPPSDPAGNVDAAMAFAPKLVLVSYPSNDTVSGFSVDETVHNLLAIRSVAQARGAAVIVLSTQPAAMTPARLALLPQIDARVSAEVGPCFVAVREALAAPNGTLSPTYDSGDGVHPNEAGHALIYSRVASVLDSGQCVRTQ